MTAPQADKHFIYMRSGWLKLFKEAACGEEVVVDILTRDHYCGELFLYTPLPTDEAYTVQAIADVELLMLPLSALRRCIDTDHKFAAHFLQSVLCKQRQLVMDVEHLSIQNALQRIGCFVLRSCTIAKDNTAVLHLPYDKTLLASRLGMRAETFSRALTKFNRQHAIKTDGRMLQIGDVNALVQATCQHCSKRFPCR